MVKDWDSGAQDVHGIALFPTIAACVRWLASSTHAA